MSILEASMRAQAVVLVVAIVLARLGAKTADE
jgi:hypothetical protein